MLTISPASFAAEVITLGVAPGVKVFNTELQFVIGLHTHNVPCSKGHTIAPTPSEALRVDAQIMIINGHCTDLRQCRHHFGITQLGGSKHLDVECSYPERLAVPRNRHQQQKSCYHSQHLAIDGMYIDVRVLPHNLRCPYIVRICVIRITVRLLYVYI